MVLDFFPQEDAEIGKREEGRVGVERRRERRGGYEVGVNVTVRLEVLLSHSEGVDGAGCLLKASTGFLYESLHRFCHVGHWRSIDA
jgi:hypothetical protein